VPVGKIGVYSIGPGGWRIRNNLDFNRSFPV
jgi:hypothetical protein